MLALRADWSFERFIPTEATSRAYEQATAFANEAARAPRVLLLWGRPGTGKSHLLEAILRVARERDNSARLVRVTAAELVQRLVDRSTSWLAAVLAVDDLHVLRNRPATQGEVAAAFKSVVDSGGRVACTAGCTPAELPSLASLLREMPQSRLIQLRPARGAAMRRVVASLAVSESTDLTPSELTAMAAACCGDVRRAIGALARHRFEREGGRQ